MCVDSLVLVTSLVSRLSCNGGGDLKMVFLSILWESLCGNEARLGAKNQSQSDPYQHCEVLTDRVSVQWR